MSEKNVPEKLDTGESNSSIESIESKEVLEKLVQAFSKLDVNHDGTISKQEFITGILADPTIQKILHIPIEKSPAKSPVSGKTERRGSLKLREKDQQRRAVRTRNLGIALKYFKRIDTDDSGIIDVNEFSSFFHSKRLEEMIQGELAKPIFQTKNLSQQDSKMVKQLFDFLDSDKSGMVSYVELCEGMGPSLANEMFSTMDEDGNKYLGFDEILHALDSKFKEVKEQDRVKKLGELAKSCLQQSKISKKNQYARTSFVPSTLKLNDRKSQSSTPISPPVQKPPPVDLLEEYAKKVDDGPKSILDSLQKDKALEKLTE
uniref:EF-hand domain-containing protein n=1 Tax=Lotharella oceanica TaxID=641309 RepID=A0A7S2XIF6_9EUKA